MKKLIYLLICICLFASISGCGSEQEEEYFETTLSFNKDGNITDVIVESFEEEYYSEDGLKAYFQEKISEFNSTTIGGDSSISLDELTVDGGVAKATLKFDSSDTYTKFYGAPVFYGSVSDAYDKGYISETVLKKVGSSETISKVDLMKMSDADLIIVSEVVRIHSPKKIVYTSANVEIIDDKNVRVSSESSGMAYILLK